MIKILATKRILSAPEAESIPFNQMREFIKELASNLEKVFWGWQSPVVPSIQADRPFSITVRWTDGAGEDVVDTDLQIQLDSSGRLNVQARVFKGTKDFGIASKEIPAPKEGTLLVINSALISELKKDIKTLVSAAKRKALPQYIRLKMKAYQVELKETLPDWLEF